MARALALLALSTAAMAAQTTTVSVFMPMFDQQTMEASVVGADASKTTYFVTCPTGVDSSECGVAESGQSFVYGPSTFQLAYSFTETNGDYYTEDLGCKLVPTKDLATCSMSVYQSYDGTTTTSATTTATNGYLKYLFPITVTAGADKLQATGSDSGSAAATSTKAASAAASVSGSVAATKAAAVTQSGSSSGSAASGTAASGSASGSKAAGSAAATPTSSGNGAVPMITQNAFLAGAAAFIGGAVMLL